MDVDGLTFACATSSEAAVAKRLGLAHTVIGLGGANGVPDGRVVSFGLAGALHDGVALGDVIDATRVVAVDGSVLWEGGPLASVVSADGKLRWPAFAHAVGVSPLGTGRAVLASLRALKNLERAAA